VVHFLEAPTVVVLSVVVASAVASVVATGTTYHH
jgi:hypothetical protein